MKTNQRTIKVYDDTHILACKLSNKYSVSMAALVELGLRELSKKESLTITLPVRNKRYAKANARRAVRKVVAV